MCGKVRYQIEAAVLPVNSLELDHIAMEETSLEIHLLQESLLIARIDFRLEDFYDERFPCCLHPREKHLGEGALSKPLANLQLVVCVELCGMDCDPMHQKAARNTDVFLQRSSKDMDGDRSSTILRLAARDRHNRTMVAISRFWSDANNEKSMRG